MAKVPEHHVRETTTLQVARFIVKYRAIVATFLILTTLFFLYPTVNAISTGLGFPLPGPVVRVDASERALWPDHPFVHAQDKFSKSFGSSAVVAIALVVEDGNIFTPETLAKIRRIIWTASRRAPISPPTTVTPTSATNSGTRSRRPKRTFHPRS
jgi:predicted RND superfamily exporter protein